MPYGPNDEPDYYPDSDSRDDRTGTAEFGADTYERLKLTQAARRLARDQKAKYDSKRECLALQLKLAEVKLREAHEHRLAAEAGRERAREEKLKAREKRKLLRDRRQLLELRRVIEENKLQTAEQYRWAINLIADLERTATDEQQKRMLLEIRMQVDEERRELRICPRCSADSSYDREADAMVCSSCGHQKRL